MNFRERGSSFVELLSVIAVTGIIAAASIPSFTPIPDRHTVRLESKKLLSRMRESMVRAREYGELPEITFRNSGYAITSNGNGAFYSLPPSFVLESTVTAIRFFPGGAVTPGRITIERGSYICYIIVSLRGRMTRKCAV